jgi:hypothetical protein
MKRLNVLLLTGIAMGVAAYLLLRNWAQPRRVADIHLTTQDLDYQNLSPEVLVSDHLTDLNEADAAQLRELGLDSQSMERLIDNRPYRSKLELVSRMVLAEGVYAAIKDKVAVADGREPVKVA